MKAYTAERDCLTSLHKKMRAQLEDRYTQYSSTRSEKYRGILAADIIKITEAMESVERTKQLLEIAEL